MKNGLFLFAGLFIALALSWASLAVGTHAQLGDLQPYFVMEQNKSFPEPASGIAERGRQVYQDLGCAACHTQAVRRPGFGGDIERKWGTRQSVSRDYIYQDRVHLGLSRVGPDLTNVGQRLKTQAEIYQLLYNGTAAMPGYAFLFEKRTEPAQPTGKAVAVSNGVEIVPTERAESLAAYLLSLSTTYEYPEAKPFTPKPKEEHK